MAAVVTPKSLRTARDEVIGVPWSNNKHVSHPPERKGVSYRAPRGGSSARQLTEVGVRATVMDVERGHGVTLRLRPRWGRFAAHRLS